jgi:hypothetical protein
MYEMYPDAWPVRDDRQSQDAAAKPHRRARKVHSVVPAVLPQTDPSKTAARAA